MKLLHIFYFIFGINLIIICTEWFSHSLLKQFNITTFITTIITATVYNVIISIVVFVWIKNLVWKIFVINISIIIEVAVILPIYNFSPFVLGIIGIGFLTSAMIFFYQIKSSQLLLSKKQIQKWLSFTITIFVVFVSSIMVGFIISFGNMYSDAVNGVLNISVIYSGMDANIIITMYYWVGAVLIFFSGIKHIWLKNM